MKSQDFINLGIKTKDISDLLVNKYQEVKSVTEELINNTRKLRLKSKKLREQSQKLRRVSFYLMESDKYKTIF